MSIIFLTKARPSKTYRVSSISCHTVFLVKVKFLKWKIVALAPLRSTSEKCQRLLFTRNFFNWQRKQKKCKTKIQVNETRKPLQNYALLANTLHNSLSLPHTLTHRHTHLTLSHTIFVGQVFHNAKQGITFS